MSLGRILSKRYQWEECVRGFKLGNKYKYHGTVESLQWFVINGKKSNSMRPRYREAVLLAKEILNETYGQLLEHPRDTKAVAPPQ